jgi:hypothetical protein
MLPVDAERKRRTIISTVNIGEFTQLRMLVRAAIPTCGRRGEEFAEFFHPVEAPEVIVVVCKHDNIAAG